MEHDIKLYFRGTSTRKVFPVGGNNQAADIKIIGSTKPEKSTRLGQRDMVYSDEGLMGAINASDYKQPKQIMRIGKLDIKANDQNKRVYDSKVLSPSLTTMQGGGQEPKISIRENTKKGYDVAYPGDSVNYSVPTSKTRRGRVGKGIANTLDTGSQQGVVTEDIRIRKLTPRECFRLQGFPDELFDKAQKVNSDSQLYKQAGNSVTVNVIYEIAKKLKEQKHV